MNGATADPWVNTINPPINTNTIRIGSNQNFFRTFKNFQNSAKKDILTSKLIFHTTGIFRICFSLNPIRIGCGPFQP